MKKIIAATFVAAAFLILTAELVTAGTVIGVNFCDAWDKPHMEGKTADGFSNWTDSWPLWNWDDAKEGTGLVILGSSDFVTCDWSSANTWAAGSEDASEQQLYRVYLDDGGNGARVSFSGLSAWLASEGATGYTVRVYHSTDNASGFAPVNVWEGDALLTTVQSDNLWTTDGGYRAYVDTGLLEADSIIVGMNRIGDVRGTIAAIKITAIPEPATLVLLGLGGLVLRRKRS